MAETTKISSHARSVSLPSVSHPLIAAAEKHLQRLKSCEAVSTSNSHALVCKNLDGLRKLCECVDDVLQLPLSQQAVSRQGQGKCAEESLRLLDICGTTGDAFSHLRGNVQELESSLRRRRGGDQSGLASQVCTYLTATRKLAKAATRCLIRNSKTTPQNRSSESIHNEDSNAIHNLVREVEEISFAVLESSLSLISGAGPKPSGWSLVLKLFPTKRSLVRSQVEDDKEVREVEKIDRDLLDLSEKLRWSKEVDVGETQDLLKRLQAFELNIQRVEEGLESIFGVLMKTRVTVLNALNH